MENILSKIKPKSIYFSTEQFFSVKDRKAYRKVFYTSELEELYASFIFYNKLFDEEYDAVEVTVKVLCNDYVESFELKNFKVNVSLDKEQNIAYEEIQLADEEELDCWDTGEYTCEIWGGDEILISESFTIDDPELKSLKHEDFIQVNSFKLFTGDSNSLNSEDRKIYLSRFFANATKYIWAELEVANKLEEDWQGEFVFSFYNEIKELKYQECKIVMIENNPANKNVNLILCGTGNDTKVTWEEDNYTVEVVFMNELVATAFFEVGDTNSSAAIKTIIPSKENLPQEKIKEIGDEEKIFNEIDSLVGLNNIKRKLHDHYAYVKYLKLREQKGLEKLADLNLNFVFEGNPGTGKTTVALLLGKIYKQLGILPKDSVYEADRSDLVGRYIGDTAPLTKEVIEKARGGILFIDEAYALWRDDEKDFGRESIEILVKELSDGKGDLAIVVAGYPKEMKEFIESNTGLKSRFNIKFEFSDYSPDELLEIAKRMIKQKSLELSETAEKEFYKIIVDAYRKRDKHFGNARFISSMVEEAQVNLGLRIISGSSVNELTEQQLSEITSDDIIKIREKENLNIVELPVNEELLTTSLNSLNKLVGLNKVKNKVKELVKLARFYKESEKRLINSISLHNVFVGNPGTGKTTVARIIADIYKALGLLERGQLFECSRDKLVAGYVGQTAIKTKDVIDDSLGGILFIDEAYSLTEAETSNDFGHEAIEVILKAMEDNRGEFGVIAAGYTDEMVNFLDANPGLRSRFDSIIEFEDFDADDLMIIANNMIVEQELKFENKASDHLYKFFEYQFANRDKFFGNARFVRKVIDTVIRNQHLRLAELESSERKEEIIKVITFDDVDDFIPQKDFMRRNRKQIGF